MLPVLVSCVILIESVACTCEFCDSNREVLPVLVSFVILIESVASTCELCDSNRECCQYL